MWLENLGGQPPAFVQHALDADGGSPSAVGVGDVDRDGRLDIVAGTIDTGRLWVFRNLGGSPPAFRRCDSGASVTAVRDISIVDLDGDHDPDVVGRGRLQAFWFENLLCVADFNRDGLVDARDLLAFLNSWSAGEVRSDINGDGAIDTRDVLAFLNAWLARC